MLNQIVNRLRGQVCIRVETPFPERILNLCGVWNLAFWDLEWESPTAFSCWLSRREWSALRRTAKDLDCVLTLQRREGMPYFLWRFRKRYALLAGFILCALWLSVGSFFVWDFTVEGNSTVPEEVILRALQTYGVDIGTFGFSLDAEDLRNHVLLDVPELSWLTVNVSGFRAYVQVRERVLAPEIVDERTPTNVVARREGVVQRVRVMEGVPCVQEGTTVEAGQLLISGVEDTGTFGARILAGMGEVQARTWYTLATVFPREMTVKRYTGEDYTAVSLVFGTRRVKFFSNSSIAGREYDKITDKVALRLFGLPLPVTVVRECYRFYQTERESFAAAQIQRQGEAILEEYLHTLVDPYGTVSSALCQTRQTAAGLEVTLRAECQEQIGEQSPIYMEFTDE